MNAATNSATARTAHAPSAVQPTYTSWKLRGKDQGYDHEVTFMVEADGSGVSVLHTHFGAAGSASASYNRERVFAVSREEAREVYRHYATKGYKRA